VQSQRCLLHCSVKVNARQLKTYSTRKCKMSTLFSGHYLCNRSTLDVGVLGYIGIVQHKEHSPEVLSLPPGTPCIYSMVRTESWSTIEVASVFKGSMSWRTLQVQNTVRLLQSHDIPELGYEVFLYEMWLIFVYCVIFMIWLSHIHSSVWNLSCKTITCYKPIYSSAFVPKFTHQYMHCLWACS